MTAHNLRVWALIIAFAALALWVFSIVVSGQDLAMMIVDNQRQRIVLLPSVPDAYQVCAAEPNGRIRHCVTLSALRTQGAP